MPQRPKSPCTHPGCGALTDTGKCAEHRGEYDRQRGTAAKRLYGYRWQKARERYLRDHPLCVGECVEQRRVTAATVVDHKIPHRGDPVLFWDESNWQSLCTTCHSSVKQREERAQR